MNSSKRQKRSEFVERMLALPEFEHGALAGSVREPSQTALRYARTLVGAMAPHRARALASKLDRLAEVDASALKAHG